MYLLLPLMAPAAPLDPVVGQGYGWELLKLLLALVVVCALAYLALRVARRVLPGAAGGGGRSVRVIEHCALSARRSLWLVEVAGHVYLLGATDNSVTRLAELDPAEVPAPAEPTTYNWRELFGRRPER